MLLSERASAVFEPPNFNRKNPEITFGSSIELWHVYYLQLDYRRGCRTKNLSMLTQKSLITAELVRA